MVGLGVVCYGYGHGVFQDFVLQRRYKEVVVWLILYPHGKTR